MIERRRHPRPPHAVSMEQSANANKWNEWSKDPDRWQKVIDWPRRFDSAKAKPAKRKVNC